MVLAAGVLLLGVVALGDDDSTATPATAAPTSLEPLPTVTSIPPATTTSPPPTTVEVEVPALVGMELAKAKDTLADRGLRGTVKYASTAWYAAGTVISQSRRTGAGVRPDSSITLVVAKAPPSTTAPPPPTRPAADCHPSYPDFCIPGAPPDLDCADVGGNDFTVRPPDPHRFDREGDGLGCES